MDGRKMSKAVGTGDDAGMSRKRTPVEPRFACPWCGEREMDLLIWVEDDVVECQTCGCRYDPCPGLIWREGDPAREREAEA